MTEEQNENKNNTSALSNGIDVWITRLTGGSAAAAILLAAIYVSFPYFEKQIQGRVDQCDQQVIACVSDLKDARTELREARSELRECKR